MEQFGLSNGIPEGVTIPVNDPPPDPMDFDPAAGMEQYGLANGIPQGVTIPGLQARSAVPPGATPGPVPQSNVSNSRDASLRGYSPPQPPDLLRNAVIKGLSMANSGESQRDNIQSYGPNFSMVVDPSKIDTSTWSKSFSTHANSAYERPIPGYPGYALKMYLGDTDNMGLNTIAVVLPTSSFGHHAEFPLYYLLNSPVNSWNATGFCNASGGCPAR